MGEEAIRSSPGLGRVGRRESYGGVVRWLSSNHQKGQEGGTRGGGAKGLGEGRRVHWEMREGWNTCLGWGEARVGMGSCLPKLTYPAVREEVSRTLRKCCSWY